MSPEPVDCRGQRGRAQHQSARAEDDHDDIPERPAIVKKRKVEAVKSVIQPAVHAREPLFLAHDRAAARIEVEPRALRIVEPHADNRQRQHTGAIVIVRIVIGEPCCIGDGGRGHRRARGGDERVAIESDRRRR